MQKCFSLSCTVQSWVDFTLPEVRDTEFAHITTAHIPLCWMGHWFTFFKSCKGLWEILALAGWSSAQLKLCSDGGEVLYLKEKGRKRWEHWPGWLSVCRSVHLSGKEFQMSRGRGPTHKKLMGKVNRLHHSPVGTFLSDSEFYCESSFTLQWPDFFLPFALYVTEK